VASASQAELAFAVDVSSLTEKGFVGTTNFEGTTVDLEFDDQDGGVFLSSRMAGRLGVRRGSTVSIIIESEKNQVVEAVVGGVGKALRISDPRVYYAVGKEGGAVIRIRRG
jgi:ABC-type lipoprotein release transport system permease subunit